MCARRFPLGSLRLAFCARPSELGFLRLSRLGSLRSAIYARRCALGLFRLNLCAQLSVFLSLRSLFCSLRLALCIGPSALESLRSAFLAPLALSSMRSPHCIRLSEAIYICFSALGRLRSNLLAFLFPLQFLRSDLYACVSALGSLRLSALGCLRSLDERRASHQMPTRACAPAICSSLGAVRSGFSCSDLCALLSALVFLYSALCNSLRLALCA